jgi:hypothetical protein
MSNWDSLEDAAAEASFWSSLETAAQQNKEAARDYVADKMREQGIRGSVDTVVGTVNIPKSGQAVRVVDRAAFASYVIQHHPPEVIDMERYYRDAFLKKVKCVDGIYIDRDGNQVPGVALESTNGYPKVTPTPDARLLVTAALEQGQLLAALRPPRPEPVVDVAHLDQLPVTRWVEPEVKPEPKDRFSTDREAAGL